MCGLNGIGIFVYKNAEYVMIDELCPELSPYLVNSSRQLLRRNIFEVNLRLTPDVDATL